MPPAYLILAPLFTLWDGVSMLSMSRLRGFLAGLAGLYLVWRVARLVRARVLWSDRRPARHPVRREVVLLLGTLAGFVLFVAAGLLWHRPMAALAGAGADRVVFDVHSHTNVSHDVGGPMRRLRCRGQPTMAPARRIRCGLPHRP